MAADFKDIQLCKVLSLIIDFLNYGSQNRPNKNADIFVERHTSLLTGASGDHLVLSFIHLRRLYLDAQTLYIV